MVEGIVLRFADGGDLVGDVFGWVEHLRNLSKPGFYYDADNPFHDIMDEVSPFELTKLVDYAIRKHRSDIRKLKALELECQRLEVFCMVEQAYMAGAREVFLEGVRLGLVPTENASEMRQRIKSRWEALWRLVAGGVCDQLSHIRQNVQFKGRKSRPATATDVNSLKGQLDESILADIHNRAPKLDLSSDEYAIHMKEGIVPEVKRYIRVGKLAGGADPSDFQEAVDKNSRRLRRRLDEHLEKFRRRAGAK